MRYIVAIVLFLVIVGGITWVIQFHSSWHTNTPPPPPATNKSQEVLHFRRPTGGPESGPGVLAVWELKEQRDETGRGDAP